MLRCWIYTPSPTHYSDKSLSGQHRMCKSRNYSIRIPYHHKYLHHNAVNIYLRIAWDPMYKNKHIHVTKLHTHRAMYFQKINAWKTPAFSNMSWELQLVRIFAFAIYHIFMGLQKHRGIKDSCNCTLC